MEIYLEETLILNSFVYLSFLYIISCCFHFKLFKVKCIFACLISSMFILLFTLFNLNMFTNIILETIITLFLLSFSIKNLNFKKLVQGFVLFVVLSNLFRSASKFFTKQSNILLASQIPIYLFLLLLFIFVIIIRKCFDIIILKAKHSNNICNIELSLDDKKICTTGLLDTGNNLTLNSEPVNIINFKLFNSLTGISLSNFLSKNYSLTNQQYIKVSTITGSRNLLSFQVDELKIINNKQTFVIKKPKVALSLKFNSSSDYDVILNNNFI